MEGNIVVDGVLASCYASIHHDIAHCGMIPIQWFSSLIIWIFGEEKEYSVYVKIDEDFGKLVLPFTKT